jgi:hypothetical protein
MCERDRGDRTKYWGRRLPAHHCNNRMILLECVGVSADGRSATALIARSKTDQEGAGAVRWVSPRTAAALRAWLDCARIASGPLFRAIRKNGVAKQSPLEPGLQFRGRGTECWCLKGFSSAPREKLSRRGYGRRTTGSSRLTF